MNLFRNTLAALVLGAFATCAGATVITFSGDPAATFADGTISHQVDDQGYDNGMYPLGGDGSTRAYNSSGTAETFRFNAPVTFDAVTLLPAIEMIMPDHITVSLYGAGDALLSAQTFDVPGFYFDATTLTFDVAAVSKAVLSYSFDDATDTRAAYFVLQDVTYDVDAPSADVPEPASLALFGLGACAVAALRRKRRA